MAKKNDATISKICDLADVDRRIQQSAEELAKLYDKKTGNDFVKKARAFATQSDDLSPEDMMCLVLVLHEIFIDAKEDAKKRFTPKKYRSEERDAASKERLKEIERLKKIGEMYSDMVKPNPVIYYDSVWNEEDFHEPYAEFAENLRVRRVGLGIRRKQLADACGLSEERIEKYEMGVQIPYGKTAEKMATLLGITVKELLCVKFPKVEQHRAESLEDIYRCYGRNEELQSSRQSFERPLTMSNSPFMTGLRLSTRCMTLP